MRPGQRAGAGAQGGDVLWGPERLVFESTIQLLCGVGLIGGRVKVEGQETWGRQAQLSGRQLMVAA